MNKTISAVLLAIGVVLLMIGINASQSFSSDVSRFFTGEPTDRAIWFLLGGMALAVLGGVGILRGARA